MDTKFNPLIAVPGRATRVVRLRRNSRGQIAIIMALCLVVLVAMAGLAVDSGRAYGVKAKLNAAVDTASIAGARALSQGATDAERMANAQEAATRYFQANFPNSYLGAAAGTIQTTTVHDAAGYWRVTARGMATMPVTLLQLLPSALQSFSVVATGQAIRRDVDVMLVLDTSGSLGPPTSPSDTLSKIKAAAINGFVSRFAAAPGGDRVGLVSFASGAVLDVAINKTSGRGFVRSNSSHTGVEDRINALTITGSTAQAEGLRRGLAELEAVPVNVRSGLRVILLFSDGAPNDVSAGFTRTPSSGPAIAVSGDLYSETDSPATARATRVYRSDQRDQQLGDYNDIVNLPAVGLGGVPLGGRRALTAGTPYANTRCNVNKAARNMVENVADAARSEKILVYTIGLGARLNSNEITFCGYNSAEYGSAILRRLANDVSADTYDAEEPTGRYCYAADADQLATCFSDIASEVLRLTQ
jgi:Flp pilus assembly protein TadG